jgi:hypothetical protein
MVRAYGLGLLCIVCLCAWMTPLAADASGGPARLFSGIGRIGAVDMLTPSMGWASSPQRLFHTDDGGSSWEVVMALSRHTFSWDWAASRNDAWVAVSPAADQEVIVEEIDATGKPDHVVRLHIARCPCYVDVSAMGARHAWILLSPDHGMSSSPGGVDGRNPGVASRRSCGYPAVRAVAKHHRWAVVDPLCASAGDSVVCCIAAGVHRCGHRVCAC